MTYSSTPPSSSPIEHDTASCYASNASAFPLSLNGNVKQPAITNISHLGYDRFLGLEDLSQSSSEDSSSQSSESSIPLSPNSSTSDDLADTTHQEVADLCLSTDGDNVRHSLLGRRHGQAQHPPLQNSNSTSCQKASSNNHYDVLTNAPQWHPTQRDTATTHSLKSSRNATPTPKDNANVTSQRRTRNVPYRPKSDVNSQANRAGATQGQQNTSTDTTNTLNAQLPIIPLDTSCVAADVQRSRLRLQPDTQHEFYQGRRGRSVCPSGPPRLRRDTDQTDAIVKMIVLFCTNLINSIWTPGPDFRDAPTSPQSGANVLPLQVFITETLRRSKTSYSTLQIALYYLVLLKQCLPPYASASQPAQGCRAMQCGRRMFLTALILASKYLQDRNYSARAWSKISGLPLKEINDNERRYLNIVCWDLHVPKDTFENWSKIVLNVCRLSMDPEACGQGSNQQYPGPGAGPSPQGCFLQNMCKENLIAMRNWWLSNLKAISTDTIRCAKKTERYVSSITPFRDSPLLPRPVFDSLPSHEFTVSSSGDETPRAAECLPRLPSVERLSNYFQPNEQSHSPAATMKLPPPPMIANLPTPQTTPRTDMSRMWTPHMSKPGLRCRASASALGNLDRNRCPMANLETCPPPKPRQCPRAQRPWREYESVPATQIPDRSLTSSPESVVSDVFSMPARSRSSSISSTSSWMTSASSSVGQSDKDRAEALARQLNSVQQQFSHQYASGVAGRRQQSIPRRPAPSALQTIERPQTAFKMLNGESPDHCMELETLKHSAAQEDLMYESHKIDYAVKHDREARERADVAQMLAELQAGQRNSKSAARPSLQRYQTQIYEPQKWCINNQQLKRSRSESLDHGSGESGADDEFEFFMNSMKDFEAHNNMDSSYWLASRSPSFAGSTDHAKETQQPYQSYLPPRTPVQLAAQHKRIALQASPAAQLASGNLRDDIVQRRLGSVY